MSDVFLGHLKSGTEFVIPQKAFETHFHLIGGTGKGKTTAIHTMLHPLLRDHRNQSAFFIIDRMGNLSWELLLWITSRFCPASVRERVLYIEPAREDVVIGFNPLLYDTPQHGYFKVQRATDIILRAWESSDIEAMPRLARWVFNSFWAAAQLGLTIADCAHLLIPGSQYHRPILNALPPLLKAEWEDIINARGEAVKILDSSRNRLKPYLEAPILKRMFGSSKSHLDVPRLMREGRIVLLNLAPKNRIHQQLGDAIGGMVINEVLATARSLPLGVRYPTYLLLDEFQNFVGPDLESALPEVRQLAIRLILSHQSFSQLEQGDYDLTSMIFQAQSRMAFGVQGEDAEILGREFASITYDPKRIKDELYTTRQRHAGHEKVILGSWGDARAEAQNWSETYGRNWNENKSKVQRDRSDIAIRTEGSGSGRDQKEAKGGSRTNTSNQGFAEHLVPIHEEVRELASRTFYTGDEWDRVWAKRLRRLETGVALVRLVDDKKLYKVAVERSAVGYLSWDAGTLTKKLPRVIDEVNAFQEENFRSEFFASPESIDRETEERLQRIAHAPIQLQTDPGRARTNMDAPVGQENPFD